MLLRMKSSNLLTLHCSALILSWWLGSFVDLWIQDISAGGLYRVLSSGRDYRRSKAQSKSV